MLVITVEFLHGTYRADPDGTAPTGLLERGEWPPAPSRLFAALVAADGTGDRCRVTDGSELAYLESLTPPTIYADDESMVEHTSLAPRFIVEAGPGLDGTHRTQEYVGRKAAQIRPGVRVCPRNPIVQFVWPEANPSDEHRRGLELRAARVGYLGCADSPVRVGLDGDVPPAEHPRFVPDSDGDLAIGVPAIGLLSALDAHFQLWQSMGPSLRRNQSPGLRRLAPYSKVRSGTLESPTPGTKANVLWFMLGSAVSGRRVLAVTETLRRATLDRYARVAEEVPSVLHGHGVPGGGYDTARFLALADVGHARSTGRIHGVAIWLPGDTESAIVESCRTAMASATELTGPGFHTAIAPWAGATRPLAAHPSRWQRPSKRWATVFPAVHERRLDTVNVDAVGDWCEHAGVPRPVAVRVGRKPFIAGALDLAPSEVNRADRPRRRYSHLEMNFDEPVSGLVAIGAGRQFGLGLCAPIHEG